MKVKIILISFFINLVLFVIAASILTEALCYEINIFNNNRTGKRIESTQISAENITAINVLSGRQVNMGFYLETILKGKNNLIKAVFDKDNTGARSVNSQFGNNNRISESQLNSEQQPLLYQIMGNENREEINQSNETLSLGNSIQQAVYKTSNGSTAFVNQKNGSHLSMINQMNGDENFSEVEQVNTGESNVGGNSYIFQSGIDNYVSVTQKNGKHLSASEQYSGTHNQAIIFQENDDLSYDAFSTANVEQVGSFNQSKTLQSNGHHKTIVYQQGSNGNYSTVKQYSTKVNSYGSASDVFQSGDFNTGMVEQRNGNHEVILKQNGGNFNYSIALQENKMSLNLGSAALIMQSGSFNDVFLDQINDTHNFNAQQIGWANYAGISQLNLEPIIGSGADVIQNGQNNYAGISQEGSNNASVIQQTGAGNRAIINQK